MTPKQLRQGKIIAERLEGHNAIIEDIEKVGSSIEISIEKTGAYGYDIRVGVRLDIGHSYLISNHLLDDDDEIGEYIVDFNKEPECKERIMDAVTSIKKFLAKRKAELEQQFANL